MFQGFTGLTGSLDHLETLKPCNVETWLSSDFPFLLIDVRVKELSRVPSSFAPKHKKRGQWATLF
ncbi:MAG: hypothetical protein JWN74_381 [Acidobacteriaceae bacterium]|nr:hypothetical protein [Acidobacteriaceae bacterium]